jgi:hypothetical protein
MAAIHPDAEEKLARVPGRRRPDVVLATEFGNRRR